MKRFEYSSVMQATVEQVWAFHDRPDILEILTPPWQPVEVVRREGGLGIGAESEFKLWLGPVPVTWLSRHVECAPPLVFADRQVQGPMAFWLHRHCFKALEPQSNAPGQMRLTDAIEYELPAGETTEPLLQSWIASRLTDMFAYRHRVTKLACEPVDPSRHSLVSATLNQRTAPAVGP